MKWFASQLQCVQALHLSYHTSEIGMYKMRAPHVGEVPEEFALSSGNIQQVLKLCNKKVEKTLRIYLSVWRGKMKQDNIAKFVFVLAINLIVQIDFVNTAVSDIWNSQLVNWIHRTNIDWP